MIKRRGRGAVKALGVLLCALLLTLHYSKPMCRVRALPKVLYLSDGAAAEQAIFEGSGGGALFFKQAVAASQSGAERLMERTEDGATLKLRLFGVLPVRTITVEPADEVWLVPGGEAVGITIRTAGVLVVGLGTVETASGALSPGTAAGLKAGDVILTADGVTVVNAAHLKKLTNASTGALRLGLERDGEAVETTLIPVQTAADGARRIGVWVRDSTAGVGTVSFYDAERKWFAALGHPISDIDTQSLLPIREGRVLDTEIIDVRRGEQGSPGELIGAFTPSDPAVGEILVNSAFGIYGEMIHTPDGAAADAVQMAYAAQAHEGPAKLLATVGSEGVTAFDCEIVRINTQYSAATKGMIVDVKDARLMETTGGIVQGMSGCPVVQDGRLIGVVTHVFVNDPTRGYCVYAEWMYEQMKLAAAGG